MKEGQEAIYYLAGTDMAHLKSAPQLEGFATKGFEVLLLADPIDAFWPGRLGTYKDKKLVSASQAGDIFGKAETDESVTALCAALAKALGEKVSDVTASTRLSGSPALLVAGAHGPDLAMQRLLRRAGRPVYGPAPKLEINPEHALIKALAGRTEGLESEAGMLLDLAKLQEGDLPDDPAGFVRQVAAAMAR
jgi:molecular chaperone HtpG